MFSKYKYKTGTTRSLLYWQMHWLTCFLRTWFHILYRPAYWKWKRADQGRRIRRTVGGKIGDTIDSMDEGFGSWEWGIDSWEEPH